MIGYQITHQQQQITNIVVKGHAMYSESGTDIVCAAVSTAIIMTVNQLDIFNQLSNVDYEILTGNFKLKVLSNNDLIQNILKNLEYTLNDLKNQYPKNIKNL